MKEVIFLVMCFVMASYADDSDYMALMGQELRLGMDYHIDIFYPGKPSGQKSITASLRQLNGATSALAWIGSTSGVIITPNEYTGRITIPVPDNLFPGTKYYLFLTISGEKTMEPGKEVKVAVLPASLNFIQTNKGIYKATETVELRVLAVTKDLKPITTGDLDLQIKDPKDNIVLYERDLLTSGGKGLAHRTFIVPKDPILGTYTAVAEGKWGTSNVTFDVAEYTLPKFEVMVELENKYVVDPFYYGQASGDVTITGKVKAVYTYGAFVRGTMTVTQGDITETFRDFDGEEPFSFRITRGRGDETHELPIFAEMTEQYTDITANATTTFSIYDAEYRTLVIKPIPNTVEGDSDYKFFAQLTDSSGQRVGDIQNFKWTVAAVLSYQTNNYEMGTATKNFSSEATVLTSNPVEITLPSGDMGEQKSYYTNITVTFVEKSTNRTALTDTFTPVKYQSNSKNALFIDIVDKNTETLMSNTETYELSDPEVCFKVRSSSEESTPSDVFFQVIGNFYPEQVQRLSDPSAVKCLDLTLENNAPKSMIMAYMLNYGDGSTTKEFLVASVTVDLEWRSPHQVTLTINPTEQYPNKAVTITVGTEGAAVVGLNVIDQSLTYIAKSNDITNEKMKSAIEQYQIFGKDKEDQGSNYPGPMPMWRGYIPPYRSGPETTSAGAKLKEAGLTHISLVQVYGGNSDQEWRHLVMATDNDAGGNGNEPQASDKQDGDVNESLPPQESSIRTEFPETWLFNIVETDERGEKEIQKKCPGTITTWLVNAFALNDDKGMGVAPTAELKCFQPFFVTLNLPYSIVRGENFDVQAIVFNYNNEAMNVQVKLIESTDEFVVLNDQPLQKTLTIQPGTSEQHIVPIRANTIGEIILEVRAVNGNGITDILIKTLIVEPEGKEIQVSQELSGKVIGPEQTTTLTFKYSDFFTEPEPDVVRDSLRMEALIYGDMMGPFIENMEGNIGLPYGCGEQNMIQLVPSIFVAKYLKSIDRFLSETRERVATYCAKGYAAELAFMHANGGVSAFGDGQGICGCGGGPVMFDDVRGDKPNPEHEHETASSWLTGFVMKTFSVMALEKLTYVSHEILGRFFDFLKLYVDRKSDADSFFVKTGKVIHDDMQGGTGSGLAYTAYTTLALIEYNKFLRNLTQNSRRDGDLEESAELINEAVTWMLRKTATLSKRFELSLVAFALARAGEYEVARALLQKAETANSAIVLKCPRYMRWGLCVENQPSATCDEATCASGMLCCDSYCGGKMCTKGDNRGGPSDTESHGYALLAYLALNDYQAHTDELRKHADWLLANRKAGGRFVSTQDTVVALEALAEYASKFKDEAVADYIVTVATTPPVSVVVDRNNYEIQQRKELDIEWVDNMAAGELNVNIVGNAGTAFVTLVARYNSKNNETQARTIELTTVAEKQVNKSLTHIKTCFKPVRPVDDTSKPIGDFFILGIKLQSGQTYDSSNVDLADMERKGVTKIENEQGKVTLYFELDKDTKYNEHCTYTPVKTDIEVRALAPGKAEVYDYYNVIETKVEAFYGVETCYENCGPPTITTKGPTIGASSVYISGVLLVAAFLAALGFY